MGVILGLLRAIPAWAWVVAVALAWGGFQHHRATAAGARALAAERDLAALRADAAQQAITTLAKTAAHYKEVSDDARKTALSDAAAAAGAADALRRLRERATSHAGGGCAAPAAAGGSAPAGAGPFVSAELFDRVAAAAGRFAAIADERGRAGAACERASDALRAAP